MNKTTINYTVKKIGGKGRKLKKGGRSKKKMPVRYIVMRTDTEISGFGRTRIVGNKKTKKEAEALRDRLQ